MGNNNEIRLPRMWGLGRRNMNEIGIHIGLFSFVAVIC